MPNININRTSGAPDTKDNVMYRDVVAPAVDYKGITLLVSVLIGVSFIAWLLMLAVARVSCWWQGEYECKATSYIFWGYISLMTLSVLIALCSAVPLISQKVKNLAFLHMRGIALHRESIREYAPELIAVAHESAKSEATAGIDNYSPSHTRTYAAPPPQIIAPAVDDDGGGDMSMAEVIAAVNK